MKIFKYIEDTVYNPAFYSAQKEGSNTKALYHLLSLILIQAVALTIVVTLYTAPLISDFTSKASIEKLIGYFPEELELTVKDGQLSTNVEEPYTITYTNPKDGTIHNVVYIDTLSQFTGESFEQSNSLIYLSKDYIVSESDKGKIELQKISGIPNMVVDRENINKWVSDIEPLIVYIIPITAVLLLIGLTISSTVGSLILLSIAAFIIWCALQIKDTPLLFGKIFRQVIYCLTLVVILNIILSIIGINLMGVFGLMIILVVYFVNTTVESQDQPLQ